MSGKGLSNNPKGRVKVAERMMTTRSYMTALAQKNALIRERPFSFEGNKLDKAKYNQFEKSAKTGVPQSNSKLNKTFANYGSKLNRLSGAMEKDKIKKGIKTAKTMGSIVKGLRNITVPGIISTIMKPKKVGDATLNKGEYRKVK
jgi:hypothetical protein